MYVFCKHGVFVNDACSSTSSNLYPIYTHFSSIDYFLYYFYPKNVVTNLIFAYIKNKKGLGKSTNFVHLITGNF